MRKSWKSRLAAGVVALAAAAAAPGCAAMSDTEKGAVLGGLAGAGIGRAIGHHNGHEAAGGWAGAGLGAVIGGMAGALSDAEKRDRTVPRADVYERVRVPAGRVVVEEEFPPIPRPVRVVRRTTTIVRTCPAPVVEERRIYVIDD